jgi:methyl-accepting chemotaxis protein
LDKLDRYFAASDAARTYVLQGKPAAALQLEASRVGYLSDQVAAALQNVRAGAEEGAMAAETKEQESAHALDLQIVMTILFAIALTAMAAVVAARYLTRRLAALTTQAAAVSRGEGDIQLAAVRFPDEIDTLTQALVTMTDHLRERADEVRATQWQVRGEVLSLIPLRNRRTLADGSELQTRISEGLTRWKLGDGRVGYGLSEYLDQIVDGQPVGLAE